MAGPKDTTLDVRWGLMDAALSVVAPRSAPALFHADHGNLGDASVVSEAALAAAYRAFGQQKGIEDRLICIWRLCPIEICGFGPAADRRFFF